MGLHIASGKQCRSRNCQQSAQEQEEHYERLWMASCLYWLAMSISSLALMRSGLKSYCSGVRWRRCLFHLSLLIHRRCWFCWRCWNCLRAVEVSVVIRCCRWSFWLELDCEQEMKLGLELVHRCCSGLGCCCSIDLRMLEAVAWIVDYPAGCHALLFGCWKNSAGLRFNSRLFLVILVHISSASTVFTEVWLSFLSLWLLKYLCHLESDHCLSLAPQQRIRRTPGVASLCSAFSGTPWSNPKLVLPSC